MSKIRVLFIHSSLSHFSGKTNKFIKFWNNSKNNKFSTSVLAIDPKKQTKDYIKNELELEIEKYNIPVYSILDFNTKNVVEIVKSISPDIILMYDDAFLMNAALNFSSRKLKIPTLYIQHGLYSKVPVKKTTNIPLFLKKTANYKLFLTFYISTKGFQVRKYYKLLKKLYRMSLYNESVNPTIIIDDFHCDYAAVWNDYNKELTINSKGYNKENTFIVGNPDGKNMFSSNYIFNSDSNKILYVSQPLVELNLITEKEFVEWCNLVSESIPESINLIIRPHPKSNLEFLKLCFPKATFSVIEDLEVKCIIGHFSTFLLKAIDYIPTLLVHFDSTVKYTDNELFVGAKKVSSRDTGLIKKVVLERTIKLTGSKPPIEYQMDFYKETTKVILHAVN